MHLKLEIVNIRFLEDYGLTEDDARIKLCNMIIKEMEYIKKNKIDLDDEPLCSSLQGILVAKYMANF